MRTFSMTSPWTKCRRIRTNSNSIPCVCSVSTRRLFKKSGRPMRLNQTRAQTSASTAKRTVTRNQRKPVWYFRQKPGCECMSGNPALRDRNGEITQDELIKHRWKDERPAFSIQCHGGQRGVRRRGFHAEIHRAFFAVFQFECDLQIICVQAVVFFRLGDVAPEPVGGGESAET